MNIIVLLNWEFNMLDNNFVISDGIYDKNGISMHKNYTNTKLSINYRGSDNLG